MFFTHSLPPSLDYTAESLKHGQSQTRVFALLDAIVEVVEHWVHPWGEWKELDEPSDSLHPHWLIGVIECLQVGGLQLWDE